MAYNSIYIDPDGVTSVSNQMLRTADELESLRQKIVPQVDEVISMTYPDIGTLPEMGIPLGSAQDSIVAFNYRAKTIVSDLRAAGYTLNQVAEEGRLMMAQLLYSATYFPGGNGDSGGSGSNGNGSGLAGFLNNLLTLLGTAPQIILKEEAALAKLAGHPGAIGAFAILGFITDFLSGSDHSPRTFVGDLLGVGVETGVGMTGIGGIALLASAGIQIGGGLLADGQNALGNLVGGPTGNELRQPATDLNKDAPGVSVNPLFNDVGKLLLDTNAVPGIGVVSGLASTFGLTLSQPGQAPTDLGNIGSDVWTIDRSLNAVTIDVGEIGVDDTLTLINKGVIQNLPLPTGVKSFANTATQNTIGLVNTTGHFIANDVPNAIQQTVTHPLATASHLWNDATSWIP